MNNLSWVTIMSIIYVRQHGNELSDDLLACCSCPVLFVKKNEATLMHFFSYFGMSQYFPIHTAMRCTLDLAFSIITGTRCPDSTLKGLFGAIGYPP